MRSSSRKRRPSSKRDSKRICSISRVHLDYTHYNKKTKDALINIPVPSSVGAPVTQLLQNVGSTQNWGNEIQANISIIQRRSFSWDVTVSGSHNNNKWLDLGIDPGTGKSRIIGSGTVNQQRVGDPLFMQWYRNYTYSDANHDGIIQQSEVSVDSALTKHGVGFAKDLVSIQNGIDLFSRRLRINAMFDYKGGGNGLDGNYFQCSSTPKACQETQDPTSPLWMQARAVAQTYGTKVNGTTYTTRLGYFMNNQFWKFRELSARDQPARATDAPRPGLQRLHARGWREKSPHLVEVHRRRSGTELRHEQRSPAGLQYEPAADLFHFPSQPEVLTQTEDDI